MNSVRHRSALPVPRNVTGGRGPFRPTPAASTLAGVTPHTIRTVAEVMSSPVVTAAPDETVAQVAARMNERTVGSVVVVDGTRPIGILTERDVVRLPPPRPPPRRAHGGRGGGAPPPRR